MGNPAPSSPDSHLFWGVLLLASGVIFLLNNFGFLHWDWRVVGKLWPALFIFWGISTLGVSDAVKKIFMVVTIMLMFLFAVGFFRGMPWAMGEWYGSGCRWYDAR